MMCSLQCARVCLAVRYLQEVGYTDTILDVRTQRVRSLLGLSGSEQNGSVENKNLQHLINGTERRKDKRYKDKRHSTAESDQDNTVSLYCSHAVLASTLLISAPVTKKHKTAKQTQIGSSFVTNCLLAYLE